MQENAQVPGVAAGYRERLLAKNFESFYPHSGRKFLRTISPYNLPRRPVHVSHRLTIPLAFVIGFNITLTQYFIADGPLSFKTQWNGDLCESNWWEVLLYIANLTGSAGACIGQTWYLMCDMQLFFCAPLLILPMYYLDKKYLGKLL